MTNLLVTGANGQLGHELRNLFEASGNRSVVYADIDTLDLTDAAAVRDFVCAGGFDRIVNCAAYTAVDKAESDREKCSRINADAVENLALAAKQVGARIIHISTDFVFDGTIDRPYKESDSPNPLSHYGATKLQGEKLLFSIAPESIVIRTAWLYSPYGNNFVKTMLRLSRQRTLLKVVSDQIGSPTCASDLAAAIGKIISSPRWVGGIYHYSGEGICSWYDFAKAVLSYAGITGCQVLPIPTEEYPAAAARPLYSLLDKSKIKRVYQAEVPHWEESLQKSIKRIIDSI